MPPPPRYVRPRIALAGDAAHKVHPLAGQGLNLGLGDAKRLYEGVTHSVASGLDIGDVNQLLAYVATDGEAHTLPCNRRRDTHTHVRAR